VVIYLLQGVSNVVPNDALRYVAFQILAPVVGLELLSYGLSLFGVAVYETTPALRLVTLVPFVRLAFESGKKLARSRGASTPLRPSGVSA
jgi:hypothetical protein